MSGSYQDKDNPPDGKVAWYPDPKMPNEKPPKGQDPESIESIEEDKPSTESITDNSPLLFASDAKPYASVSSPGEAKAEFAEAFNVAFGTNAPKGLLEAFSSELRSLQASRTTARIAGKNGDVIVQGVSPQERQDILNKYLKTYADNLSSLAQQGDEEASNALKKGTFGVTLTKLKNAYADNGLPMNQSSLLSIATDSTLNPKKLESNLNLINLQAKTFFPALADKISAGYTVKQLLSPYLQTRANILEEDADSIDLKTLQNVTKDPKNMMSLYDYEVSLRKDPKWRFTKNAQDSVSGLANDIAKMFGLVG
jgi:hypothetical protein